MIRMPVREGKRLVACLCTFSRISMSSAKYGFQIGVQYSKVGLTNVLYNIRKDGLDKNLNDLLSCPSICVALAAHMV